MKVADLQQFVNSLAVLFAAKQGNPQTDMITLAAAIEPFKEHSLQEFGAFLQLAKEYKETGKITVPAGKPKKGASAKTPVKSKNDAQAIQEAVDELERLYRHAADKDLTYTTIETTVKQIHDAFDLGGLKEVAKGFNLTSGVGTKKACREKMEHKIKERKARSEKGDIIAAAAGGAREEVEEATLVDN